MHSTLPAHQTRFDDRANLVEQNQPGFTFDGDGHAKRRLIRL